MTSAIFYKATERLKREYRARVWRWHRPRRDPRTLVLAALPDGTDAECLWVEEPAPAAEARAGKRT